MILYKKENGNCGMGPDIMRLRMRYEMYNQSKKLDVL